MKVRGLHAADTLARGFPAYTLHVAPRMRLPRSSFYTVPHVLKHSKAMRLDLQLPPPHTLPKRDTVVTVNVLTNFSKEVEVVRLTTYRQSCKVQRKTPDVAATNK